MVDKQITKVTERRVNCKDCVSHSEHSRAITNLERQYEKADQEQGRMWKGLEQRVTYGNFKWAFGILMTVITLISTINYYSSKTATAANYSTMNRILESNHQVEKGLIVVQSDIKSINEKLFIYNNEHKFFREAILALMQHSNVPHSINKGEVVSPMDRLNNRAGPYGE